MDKSLLYVAANSCCGIVHTIDEQGLVERNLIDLIAHAANRAACRDFSLRMFLNLLHDGSI